MPPDFTRKLSNSGFSQASVEVIYNGDALKQSFVESTVSSELALGDAALARQVNAVAGSYIDTIANGGRLNVLGTHFDLLGLKDSNALLKSAITINRAPLVARKVSPVQLFMATGDTNFIRFKEVFNTVEQPVTVSKTLLSGRRAALDTFAVSILIAGCPAAIAATTSGSSRSGSIATPRSSPSPRSPRGGSSWARPPTRTRRA